MHLFTHFLFKIISIIVFWGCRKEKKQISSLLLIASLLFIMYNYFNIEEKKNEKKFLLTTTKRKTTAFNNIINGHLLAIKRIIDFWCYHRICVYVCVCVFALCICVCWLIRAVNWSDADHVLNWNLSFHRTYVMVIESCKK